MGSVTTKERNNYNIFFILTKVTNNEQKRTCVFGVFFLRNKLYLQTKVENIKYYLSLKTNQKFLSLNSTSLAKYLQKKLTLFIVTVYCITTNIFYTGSKCETNRKSTTTTITTTSLSHHHPLSTILSYNSFLFFYGVYYFFYRPLLQKLNK